MRVFITGGTGRLGQAVQPELAARGHDFVVPSHGELELTDRTSLGEAIRGFDAVLHLATRIPRPDHRAEPSAWRDNDRLRSEVTRVIVEQALADGGPTTIVVPTVTFAYPPGAADESTPVGDIPAFLLSALDAERQVTSFGSAPGRRGVVLRLGSLYGPGTGTLVPDHRFVSHVHLARAGRALAEALEFPTGIYNVVDPGGPVSGARYEAVRRVRHPRR